MCRLCMCVQKYNGIHLRHVLRRSDSIHVPARLTAYMDRVRVRRLARASSCCCCFVIRYGSLEVVCGETIWYREWVDAFLTKVQLHVGKVR